MLIVVKFFINRHNVNGYFTGRRFDNDTHERKKAQKQSSGEKF